MSVAAIPFPKERPMGYEWFDDEPVFDPARHLALEKPQHIQYLTEFGYTCDEIDTNALINELHYTSNRKAVAARLEQAIKDVSIAISEIRDDSPHEIHHYEKA